MKFNCAILKQLILEAREFNRVTLTLEVIIPKGHTKNFWLIWNLGNRLDCTSGYARRGSINMFYTTRRKLESKGFKIACADVCQKREECSKFEL